MKRTAAWLEAQANSPESRQAAHVLLDEIRPLIIGGELNAIGCYLDTIDARLAITEAHPERAVDLLERRLQQPVNPDPALTSMITELMATAYLAVGAHEKAAIMLQSLAATNLRRGLTQPS